MQIKLSLTMPSLGDFSPGVQKMQSEGHFASPQNGRPRKYFFQIALSCCITNELNLPSRYHRSSVATFRTRHLGTPHTFERGNSSVKSSGPDHTITQRLILCSFIKMNAQDGHPFNTIHRVPFLPANIRASRHNIS